MGTRERLGTLGKPFILQASVCAMYSAGLSTACVVNVGDEVTHVCCVEDGMSNPNTRCVDHMTSCDHCQGSCDALLSESLCTMGAVISPGCCTGY